MKAPIQIKSSAPRKILMLEGEAEYHERPQEESPSQELIMAGCVWSPLLLPGKPSLSTLCYCEAQAHRGGEKKKKGIL